MNQTGPNTQLGGLNGGFSSPAYQRPGAVWVPMKAFSPTTSTRTAASLSRALGCLKALNVGACVMGPDRPRMALVHWRFLITAQKKPSVSVVAGVSVTVWPLRLSGFGAAGKR